MTVKSTTLEGTYFDGEHPIGRPAMLELNGVEAVLTGTSAEDFSTTFNVRDLNVSPRIATARRFILLPDGGQFLCVDQPHLDELPQEDKSEGLVAWLEGRQSIAAISVIVILATLLFSYYFGLPAAAKSVSKRIPLHTEEVLGSESLAWMDENEWFLPTEAPEDAREMAVNNFDELKKGLPSEDYLNLQFRQSDFLGANALAFPGGTIIVTDDMIALAQTEDEIIAVLAHEIAHVELRHFVRQVLQTSAVALAAAAVTADAATLSAAVAGVPTLLVQMKYSREIETEADAFAFELLKQKGISPGVFADLMERISAAEGGVRSRVSFLSSHPSTDERVKRARESAKTGS